MIRIRDLRLRAYTSDKIFGADLPFRAGLNVVYAGNTSGKSTCLQAIIFALGLERSLGPQLDVPLPYAMRERIHQHKDEEYSPVVQSFVEVEIENRAKLVVRIRRDVVGGADPKLIRTWIQEPNGQYTQQRDFFVHDPGAAQREDGFHSFLAKILGWDLPLVPRFDGSESLLYLEAIFPMLFVEQKRGWSLVQGPFPTYLRIQDITRRVMEFLLNLDAGRIRRERADIRRQMNAVQQRWNDARGALESQTSSLARLRGLPGTPTAEFAHAGEVRVEVLYDGDWTPIQDALKSATNRVATLENLEVPTAEDAAPALNERLALLRSEVDDLTAQIEAIRGEYSAEHQEYLAVQERVTSLKTDLRRNQDAAKLRRLGSDAGVITDDNICPTCHQHVMAELLPLVSGVGMALDENIAFVRSQLEMYEAQFGNSKHRLAELSARHEAVNRDLRERQGEIRSIRQSLVQPSSSPSRAAIEELVRAQVLMARLRTEQGTVDATIDSLRSIARDWVDLVDRLRRIEGEDLTASDKRKISLFHTLIQQHLERYGFRSFQPGEIFLSDDNFRPLARTYEKGELVEKEINFEISASDAIRLKWAYYVSLLEIMEAGGTNHPGLVVFDEPGQQEIEAESLYSLMRWSAQSLASDQQLIMATSEPLEKLREALSGTDANIVSFDGFILQPMSNA